MSNAARLTKLRRILLETRLDFFPSGKFDNPEIYKIVRQRFPELCDDSYICGHKERVRQPEWNHKVRDVLRDLKKLGVVANISRGKYLIGTPNPKSDPAAQVFRPKEDSDYVVRVPGGPRVQTRKHETLVRRAGEFFRKSSDQVSTPHPKDLEVGAPLHPSVVFKAKHVRRGSFAAPIREALGQLLEYRYFLGPTQADICILLDQEPPRDVIEFVEVGCGVLLAWWDGRKRRVRGGLRAAAKLHGVGVRA